MGQRSGVTEIREEGPEPGIRGLFDEGMERGGGGLREPKNQEERLWNQFRSSLGSGDQSEFLGRPGIGGWGIRVPHHLYPLLHCPI